MKRCINASKRDKNYIHVKDSDWYRLITRLQNETGMKVTNESKWNRDRDYLVLEDPKTGNKFEVEVEKQLYYVVDGKNFAHL